MNFGSQEYLQFSTLFYGTVIHLTEGIQNYQLAFLLWAPSLIEAGSKDALV